MRRIGEGLFGFGEECIGAAITMVSVGVGVTGIASKDLLPVVVSAIGSAVGVIVWLRGDNHITNVTNKTNPRRIKNAF